MDMTGTFQRASLPSVLIHNHVQDSPAGVAHDHHHELSDQAQHGNVTG